MGLRSFYEQNIKGSPLDYENAGVYASALLDAYMVSHAPTPVVPCVNFFIGLQVALEDHSNMSAHMSSEPPSHVLINVAIWEVDNGISALQAHETNDDLQELAAEAKVDYDQRLKRYQGAQQNVDKKVAKASTTIADEPIPPNAVVPYKASVFRLDHAKRDCRFEMIKIVREVCRRSRSDPHILMRVGGCGDAGPKSCH